MLVVCTSVCYWVSCKWSYRQQSTCCCLILWVVFELSHRLLNWMVCCADVCCVCSCRRLLSSWAAIIALCWLVLPYKTTCWNCGRCSTFWCLDFWAPSENSRPRTVVQYFRAVIQSALLKTGKLVPGLCCGFSNEILMHFKNWQKWQEFWWHPCCVYYVFRAIVCLIVSYSYHCNPAFVL